MACTRRRPSIDAARHDSKACTTLKVLAVDTMVVNAIALILLYGIREGTAMNFESALLLAMFSFISTVAFCRFLLRGDIIE